MRRKTQEEIKFDRQTEEYNKVKVTCKCGHRVLIPKCRTKVLCHWCNNYVYADKKEEFMDRLSQARKKAEVK